MSKMIPRDQIADNTLKMLSNNIRHYRNFGVYWYFMKAFLKRYYTKDNLYILGDFEQPEVMARMPEYENFEDAMHDALLTAYQNQQYNMDGATSIGPDDELVTLFDADAGL
jgi:hypothetical protein